MSVKNSPITKEWLEEAQAKYKRVAHVVGADDEWEVVLRKPDSKEYKMLRAQTLNESQQPMALEACFRKICIYPEGKDAVQALLDDWPGIPEACGPAINRLSGLSATTDQK